MKKNAVLCFILLIICSMLPLQSVSAAACYETSCAGKDPVASGCDINSNVLSNGPVFASGTEWWIVGIMELRYSRVCDAVWSRIIPYNYGVGMGGSVYNNSYGFMQKVGEAPRYNQFYGIGIINTAMIYDPGASWQACGGIKISLGDYAITCTNPATMPSPVSTTTNTWYLRNVNDSGLAQIMFSYGNLDDIPLVGDWNGDGIDTIGIYRSSTKGWYLRNSNSNGVGDISFAYGDLGDIPLVGDWNGDGIDTIGIYRPNTKGWYLRNSNSSGVADINLVYGNLGDIPLVGDWNGDGIDTIGIYRPSTQEWYLRNSNSNGVGDISFAYGNLGDIPLVGDWNGDGVDTIGIYRPNTKGWYLRNSNSSGVADVNFVYGNLGDKPIVGDWNNDNMETPGLVR